MGRRWLRRTGVAWGTVIITGAATVVSVAITYVVERLVHGEPNRVGLLLSAIIPIVLATPVNYVILRLIYMLDAAEERLRELALLDSLTGAYNRRAAFEALEKELERVRRYGGGRFGLLIIDLDHFKGVNDEHGHLAGDKLLRAVSDLCRERSRRTDTFARYGGEEFLLLMPSTDPGAARDMAERLVGAIRTLAVEHAGASIRITASIGVAFGDERTATPDMVLGAADEALYRAKHEGRDRVCAAPEQLDLHRLRPAAS